MGITTTYMHQVESIDDLVTQKAFHPITWNMKLMAKSNELDF